MLNSQWISEITNSIVFVVCKPPPLLSMSIALHIIGRRNKPIKNDFFHVSSFNNSRNPLLIQFRRIDYLFLERKKKVKSVLSRLLFDIFPRQSVYSLSFEFVYGLA